MQFKIGDKVTWTIQSHGSHKTKVGEVVGVIPIGDRPGLKLFPELWKGAGPGYAREMESYIVNTASPAKARKLYWPRVPVLKPV